MVEKYPEHIFNLFILDKNPSHIYAVRMFIDGKWTTIMLDTCFPANQYGDLCAAQSYNNQIWVMLLEKAWAKIFGSYDNIISGTSEEGLTALSGAPCITFTTKDKDYFIQLQSYLKNGSIVNCSTSQ